MIETDVIKGRRAMSYKSIETDVVNAGAKWEGSEVVVDRGIMTSRNPRDLKVFSRKIIEEIAKRKNDRRVA